MDIDTINQEKDRLELKLAGINEEIKIYSESASDMLKFVITFSELFKNTGRFFSQALDSEKRDVTTTIFSELIITNKNLTKYDTKKGFTALVDRSWVTGSPVTLFSELYRLYPLVKGGMIKIGSLSFLPKIKGEIK